MCGLFGLLRAPGAPSRRASLALVEIGLLAQERGVDAAGLALVTEPAHPNRLPGSALAGVATADLGDLQVIKGCRPFAQVWDESLLPELDRASVALGHTRWATQGASDQLVNASPLALAGRVFTHNGDIDVTGLHAAFDLPSPRGTTDSEPLFRALAAVGESGPGIATLLEMIVGRAALAWIDRSRPDRVHLARAALSPLAVCRDEAGNVFWASNPRWLRDVVRPAPDQLRIFDEGTYVCLTAGLRPMTQHTFRPTARSGDLDDRVWTGFSPTDMAADRARLRHLVTP